MAKAKDNGDLRAPTIRGDLVQRDVRNFDLEMAELPDRLIARQSSSYHEAALKAAIGAGWIEEPACKKKTVTEDGQRVAEYYYGDTLVDDLPPKLCYNFAHPIVELYQEFTTVDPT